MEMKVSGKKTPSIPVVGRRETSTYHSMNIHVYNSLYSTNGLFFVQLPFLRRKSKSLPNCTF